MSVREHSRRAAPARELVLLVMCAGYFLVLLDVTIVNVALPTIGNRLHADVSELQWVLDGYALALGGLMLAGGSVGDLYGHKRIVLCGLALFGLASLGCGVAGSAGVLVAFRVVQGLGAALMLPGTLAVIANAYPVQRDRARAIGVWAGVGSCALPAGPLLGGLLVQTAGWRWVFLLNVPIVAVALVAAGRVVTESREPTTRALDLPGAALGAVALVGVTFAVISGGHGGSAVPTVIAGACAVAGTIAFVAAERRARDPLLPLGLLRQRAFVIANAVAGAMNLATLGLLFVVTLYLQDVRHDGALTAGILLLPLFVPLSVLAPVGGRIVARAGSRPPMIGGLLLAAVGVGLLTLSDATTGFLTMLPAVLLWGMGLALLTPAVVSAAVAAVPAGRAGLGSAVNNSARQAAGAIGIAAFGAIASTPGSPGFVHRLHVVAIVAAALFVAGAAATVAISSNAYGDGAP
ncbi:MAG TPA: MFS transporter [Solirubrobacteraceae bacterium]|jgi:DHA2 family methylenomycin A resistance protein-like MFS transporter